MKSENMLEHMLENMLEHVYDKQTVFKVIDSLINMINRLSVKKYSLEIIYFLP